MLTASAEAGLIDQQEYFQKRVASHNLSHYYLLERGDFAYNHSSSGNAVLGIIKRLDAYDSGCLSTLYIVFHPKRDIDSDYLLHYFESSAWHGDVAGMVTEGARNHGLLNISPDTFFTARCSFPSLPEQRRIGKFFIILDNLIAAAERQEALLRQKKQAYLQLMFPQEGETQPRLRFAGFSGRWERRQLGDVISAAGIKNKERQNLQSYSISNQSGFVPQSEQFDNGGKPLDADKSSYWIVAPHSFAYNPARINVGSIGYWDGKEPVIVSSLYEVFQTHESVDDSFLLNWFQTCLFTNQIAKRQEGGVRQYFFFDKLQESLISLPTLPEQQRIGEFFYILDSLIATAEKHTESSRALKSSYLQRMFV
ncbi:restriction endonuclease subunit S [Bifidobacterium apri]|uniref:Restriction endonuclease n=1 Tax=Bifidobacterium apri TaxID=1769423 RepID=A0A6A2W053_9BIFI|nr:restriction endonuclease subunit S [Bifidobacterium apri]KAB8301854.1 restriction endonuclease [Bifidobacterium apri]